jgi:hypothetical protein
MAVVHAAVNNNYGETHLAYNVRNVHTYYSDLYVNGLVYEIHISMFTIYSETEQNVLN